MEDFPQAEALRTGQCPEGLIVLEGALLIERAKLFGLQLESIHCVPARAEWARSVLGEGGQPIVLPEREMAGIAGYPFHRGALALARRPAPRGISELVPGGEERATVLVLPEIGDPENLGSVFRSALAFGCSALALGPRGPDPYSRRVLRVSMGASLKLPWARLRGASDLRDLARGGWSIAGCVLDDSAADLRGWERGTRLALLLGNEAFGLSQPWLDECDALVTLPMRGGMDSLNLSVAAAVFLYALA